MSVYGTGQRFLSPAHERGFYERQGRPVPSDGHQAPAIVGPGMKGIIETVNDWLDRAVAETYKDQPLAQDWARVAKLAEEIGEVMEAAEGLDLSAADRARLDQCTTYIGRAISALIACTGQNPRKGVNGTQDAMLREVADTVCCGLFAIQHFTGDAELTAAIVESSLIKALSRATGAEAPAQ